jgi:hypothetical protein
MSNVVSLAEKLETWKPVYDVGGLRVCISSHGKFKIYSGDKITQLEFFDSVTFLKQLSEALEYVMRCPMYNDTH